MCVEIYLDIHTSCAKQRLRHVLLLFADFTHIYTGELITYYFPDLLQPPVAATLPPANVDPEGQDWTPLEGGRPLGGGRCGSTSAVPR
jgi:hypothetical protein